jgi:hypothetical protein
MSGLDGVREVLSRAVDSYRDRAGRDRLVDALDMLDGPLRLAVEGLPGSGRSSVAAAFPAEPGPVDAVLYSFRTAYPSGIEYARVLAHLARAGAGPVRTVGVLTTADLVGGGTRLPEASEIESAHDPALAALVAEVVPVAGPMLAVALAAEDVAALARPDAELMYRLGRYGVRSAVGLLSNEPAPGLDGLSAGVAVAGGLARLRAVVEIRFRSRLASLRMDRALGLVDAITRHDPVPQAGDLRRRAEQLRCDDHGMAELSALAGRGLPADLRRLLGGSGLPATTRLELPTDAPSYAVREALSRQRDRWVRAAGDPLTPPDTARAAVVAVRSCDVLIPAG